MEPPEWTDRRRRIVRDAAAVGLAVGIYGLSFGALSVASGFSVLETIILSAVMFTGGSQFAYIGVLGAGGSAVAGAAAALLLGARNSLYGVTVSQLVPTRGVTRVVAAELTIDESTAMALAHEDPAEPRAARVAFWATGIGVYVGWNLFTVVGALGAASLGDPARWGLDAMVPAAFLALLWPRLRGRQAVVVALLAAAVAVAASTVLPPGLPVLLAGSVAVLAALLGTGTGRPRRADGQAGP